LDKGRCGGDYPCIGIRKNKSADEAKLSQRAKETDVSLQILTA
jgi:hypothetical protein